MTVESGQALTKHLFRVKLFPLFPGDEMEPMRKHGTGKTSGGRLSTDQSRKGIYLKAFTI